MPKTQKLSGFVFKRSNSPFYYARWWVKGKEHVQSTERKSKPEAEIVKDRLVALSKGEYSLEKAFNDFLSALSTFEDLEERERLRCKFARRLASGANEKLALVEGWKAWLDNPNKKRTPKNSTLTGYKAIWHRFELWSSRNGVEFLHEVDRSHAERYAEDLWKSHVSPSTFNAHIKLLKNIFNLLETSAGLSENVWARITRKDKTPDQGRRNFTEQELRIILSRAEGNQRVMFVLGLFTGLRLGDVVNLRWTDVDAKSGFIVVVPMKVSRLGNAKKVELPIHPALKQVLDEHRRKAKSEYLFPAERELYALNAGNITQPIQEFFNSCGIQTNEKSENGERRRAIVRVGFHSLRHSFVSLCAKAGAPQHVVQRLVGHGSPAMTEHYTHLDDQQKQAAVRALPDIASGTVSKVGQKRRSILEQPLPPTFKRHNRTNDVGHGKQVGDEFAKSVALQPLRRSGKRGD